MKGLAPDAGRNFKICSRGFHEADEKLDMFITAQTIMVAAIAKKALHHGKGGAMLKKINPARVSLMLGQGLPRNMGQGQEKYG